MTEATQQQQQPELKDISFKNAHKVPCTMNKNISTLKNCITKFQTNRAKKISYSREGERETDFTNGLLGNTVTIKTMAQGHQSFERLFPTQNSIPSQTIK